MAPFRKKGDNTGSGHDPDRTRLRGSRTESEPSQGVFAKVKLDSAARRKPAPSLGTETDGLTSLVGGLAKPQERPGQEEPAGAAFSDPVVAWLVIIAGPGQGADLRLGYGVNRIGRDSSCRVSMTFGDGKISRAPHCQITCDPESGKYYLQHAEGQNLTYLNNEAVLVPAQLTGGEKIRIGETTMVFVPFAGTYHRWTADAG